MEKDLTLEQGNKICDSLSHKMSKELERLKKEYDKNWKRVIKKHTKEVKEISNRINFPNEKEEKN